MVFLFFVIVFIYISYHDQLQLPQLQLLDYNLPQDLLEVNCYTSDAKMKSFFFMRVTSTSRLLAYSRLLLGHSRFLLQWFFLHVIILQTLTGNRTRVLKFSSKVAKPTEPPRQSFNVI